MRGGSGLFDRKQRPLTGKTQPFPFGDVYFFAKLFKTKRFTWLFT